MRPVFDGQHRAALAKIVETILSRDLRPLPRARERPWPHCAAEDADECHTDTGIVAFRAGARAPARRRAVGATARDPLQLHVLLRPGDRDPPARGAALVADRGAAQRAAHRPLGADALRGPGRYLGGAPQSLSPGRPAREQAPATSPGGGTAPSAE